MAALGLGMLLAACSGQQGKFRIDGEIEGINEDNFLIVSTDGGLDRVDTLHIHGGSFSYQCDLETEATYRIVYSNQSQLLVWGHSGDALTLTAEAQNLRNARLEGNAENELYTEFRLAANLLTARDSIRHLARTFIHEHAESPVAQEVYRQYFWDDLSAPRRDQYALLTTLEAAQPDNLVLPLYRRVLKSRDALRKGRPLPAFDLTDTRHRRHRLKDYRGRYLMLVFWAAWQSTTVDAFREAHYIHEKKTADSLDVLTISLDLDTMLLDVATADYHYPTVCDRHAWASPYVRRLGLRTLPYIILVDPKGRIMAAGSDYTRDIKAATEEIK